MCALSNHIREKTNWREEVKYKVIVERWREEALQREEVLQREEKGYDKPSKRLTPTMVKLYYIRTTATPSSRRYPGELRTRGAPRVRISARSGDWGRGMVDPIPRSCAETYAYPMLGWPCGAHLEVRQTYPIFITREIARGRGSTGSCSGFREGLAPRFRWLRPQPRTPSVVPNRLWPHDVQVTWLRHRNNSGAS